jgi:hypothetical protein
MKPGPNEQAFGRPLRVFWPAARVERQGPTIVGMNGLELKDKARARPWL